ncbi:MAG: 7,8-dihydro-6-hydroxymethylpterin dimethyltransferase [Thermodesulfobacteriota bacterium]|nr:7,8-dihydro-6-hydroxymethylpterin dimethyltransferase [Thermodesulfobacteriota bacterium]
MKLGLCEKCGLPTDACYEIRNNQVYLVKFCKDCGRTASLVTKDARKWRWKRDIIEYKDPAISGCDLNCKACDHQLHKKPNTVAIDVTNLCNQHCPICLAYVDAMGFSYHPPIEYFEKIFKHFQNQDPRPNMCFFGGEPTVHRDFISIVQMAKDYGFQVQVFTNGLKLADKEYCRELCALGIQVNFGFDGTKREIYQVLRGDNSLAAKKKAFENVIECGVNKLAVITTVANGVNDGDMKNVLEFIHQFSDHVSVWGFVPLTPCWDGEVNLDPTTTECVERIFQKLIPEVEFVPTGMMNFQVLSKFFGRQTLGGSHPNCESATLLVSDGTSYNPISAYLHVPLSELLVRLRKLDKGLASRANLLPSRGIRRFFFDIRAIISTIGVLGGALHVSKIFGNGSPWPIALALVDMARGVKIDRILANRTRCKNMLTLITIPYEDQGGLEDARLHDCPAVFAYEDVESGGIRTAAFCSWQTIKDEKCRKIQDHYDRLLNEGEEKERVSVSGA